MTSEIIATVQQWWPVVLALLLGLLAGHRLHAPKQTGAPSNAWRLVEMEEGRVYMLQTEFHRASPELAMLIKGINAALEARGILDEVTVVVLAKGASIRELSDRQLRQVGLMRTEQHEHTDTQANPG